LKKEELELIRNVKDSYLFHDHLEEVNQPVYFHQFMEHAGRHGLQFLAEADPRSALGRDLKPEVREKVRPLGGIIEREQYLDFVRYRGFRQTLLCHKDVELKRKYDPNLLRGLFVSGRARPVEGTDPMGPGPWKFVDDKGREMSTPTAVVRDVLVELHRVNPRRVEFEKIVEQIATAREGQTDALALVAEVLFELYMRSLVGFFPRQIDFAPQAPEWPVAWPLARLQAQKGERAASMLHSAVLLSPTGKRLLPLLDGTRTRNELLEEMEKWLHSGQLADAEHLRELPEESRREGLANHLEQALQRAALAGLLVLPKTS